MDWPKKLKLSICALFRFFKVKIEKLIIMGEKFIIYGEKIEMTHVQPTHVSEWR